MTGIARRRLIGALPLLAAAQSRRAALYAYAGCYTTAQRSARGDGIHVYRVDPHTGGFTHVQRVPDLVNPSFLLLSADGRRLYSVHGDETYATAFSVDPATGLLAPLNQAKTIGRNGVHLALDPSGRFLLVANYASGNIAVLPVRPDGGLADAVQLAALPGEPGPHRTEQTASHPHHIVFAPSGRHLIVPDKGLDRIFIFGFDSAAGKLVPTEQGAAVARSGSGPRHAAFHPTLPVVWVLNELSNTVASYSWDSDRGGMRPAQILPTLPAGYTGENTAAEIAVSAGGGFVYCSNRGHDSVAMFRADPRTGLLAPAGWTPAQVRTPRFIGFDPARAFLYAAGEQSDSIAVFRADPRTGALWPAGPAVRNSSPVCIVFGAGGA